MAGSSAAPEGLGETLIPAINKLQDIFNQVTLDLKLELPQVAVVGSQSSGKSSVLEALVGRDFLPRGPDICTRRPLVLQLVKAHGSQITQGEWGEFLHVPGRRYTDFNEIRKEILSETERIVGTNKGISDKPIRLKICSPHVLTMTLVDLPGIAKVPVGDQPSDIEARIRAMVSEYIRHPTCVILAVSAANVDLANSDALDMARGVDPDGHRTIGVCTKLDIMDRGTDAAAVLRNEVVPLRLGYIGVVNRSQHDINTHRRIREAQASEASFFESHTEYMDVLGQCGTANLARSLNRILVDHIRHLLPRLRQQIDDALQKRAAELRIYGDQPPGSTGIARSAMLLRLLDGYAVRYAETLDGRSEHMPVSELAGGARIRHIFQEIFIKGINDLDPAKELADEDVRTAIKNSAGVKGTLLIPDAPFELLVRRAILRLLPLALNCKHLVHGELMRIAGQCAPPDIARFPVLQRNMTTAVEEFINEGAGPAEQMIRSLVDCEHSYINTDHPGFIGGTEALATVMRRRHPGPAAEEPPDDLLPEPTPHSPVHSRSTGNLADMGAPSTSGRPAGRAQLQDQHHHKPGLKAVEPELFTAEELLASSAAARRATGHHSVGPASFSGRQPHEAHSAPSSHQAGRQGGWLSRWSGPGQPPPQPAAAPERPATAPPIPAASPPPHLQVGGSASETEEVQVDVTRLLVQSYFALVRANLEDTVPKALMHFLVLSVQRGLQQHLIRTLYREELFDEMMSEREEVAAKRVQCQSAVKALKEALNTLESLPATLMSRINSAGQYATEPGGRPRPLLGSQPSSLFTKDSAAGFPARAPSLPPPIDSQPSSPAGGGMGAYPPRSIGISAVR
ncbi:hypothetical protein WJX74_003564 [Apatococcus lobatus]|uniref:Dynamin GTPase n=2 Tax=Apatococcus TaxID=904362 RepID=A0AAW1SUS4_9CHLO